MRVVIDTNVIVSGLLNPFGKPAQILGLILDERIALCYDSRIIMEYSEVLHREKFGFPKKDVMTILDFIESTGLFVSAQPSSVLLHDKTDLPFLEVCISASAEYLITGNLNHFPKKIGKAHVPDPALFLDKHLGNQ